MITKGIIQKVHDYAAEGDSRFNVVDAYDQSFDPKQSRESRQHYIYTYDISIPVIDGIESMGDGYWTDVPAATLPHMESTRYNVGDVVYVAIEDFDLNSIIIIGMIPIVSKDDTLHGAADTLSSISMERIMAADFRAIGRTTLPVDTNMYDEEGVDAEYVRGEDLRNTAYSTDIFQNQIDRNRLSINNITSTLHNATVKILTGSEYTTLSTDSYQWDEAVWKRESGCMSQGVYMFKYEFNEKLKRNVWNMYFKTSDFDIDGDPTSSTGDFILYSSSITTEKMGTIFGITIDDSNCVPGTTKICTSVKLGPLPISMGGTGATNEDQARRNLGVYHDIIISSEDFESRIQSNSLTKNTIYYIYDN